MPAPPKSTAVVIVLLVGRKHDQKKTILRSRTEARHIEHRVIRHGQAVQREHAEDRGNSREQNRHLKRDHNKRRPRMRRLAAHIEGIIHRGHPPLHEVTGQTADNSADQHHQWNLVMIKTNLFRQPFNGKRTIGVDLLVAGFVGALGRVHQALGRIELGHDSVNAVGLRHYSLTSASGSRVRISKIEIAGRKRRNRNIAARNMPMVPM